MATSLNGAGAFAPLTTSDEVLDRQARAAFKARLMEIEEMLGQAKGTGDEKRAVELENEASALRRELVRTIGSRHRIRRLENSASERARLNVTRAIWTAVDRIERASPALGQHLSTHIRTGLYCRYRLDHETPVDWNI